MNRAVLLGCGLLAAALASGAHGQERADDARLDDFALPQAAPALRVEQLTTGDVAPPAPQAVDRTIAAPAQTEAGGAMPAQLSAAGERAPVAQLAGPRDARAATAVSVSNTADSTPGTVQRIGGQDRCDPQLTQRFYAECLRILELRSAEFSAPQAPVLSAEQALLAEQRQREDSLAESSPALRLRYATAMQPNADLQSNQELAAIFLDDPVPAPTDVPAQPELEPKLGEILRGLGIETTGPAPGP